MFSFVKHCKNLVWSKFNSFAIVKYKESESFFWFSNNLSWNAQNLPWFEAHIEAIAASFAFLWNGNGKFLNIILNFLFLATSLSNSFANFEQYGHWKSEKTTKVYGAFTSPLVCFLFGVIYWVKVYVIYKMCV